MLSELLYIVIDYRAGVYIAAYYADNDYTYNDKYSPAENERFSNAIYGVLFYEDAEEALRLGYLERDYKPVMIGGKQYYCNTEYTSNGDIMGYSIVFIVQDSLMYVHLPYAEGFEVLENCAFALDINGE